MNRVLQVVHILKNMGLRYVSFRLFFELKKRLGILKLFYPTSVELKRHIDLQSWEKLNLNFFIENKHSISFPKIKSEQLRIEAEGILKGEYVFFGSTILNLGKDYDWITNPDSGFRYDITKHWLDINDYSKEAGDIKYVWEKSRFTYLQTIMRYDFHFEIDQSEFVFSEIENWIDKNPINCGPNYKCSQEITLRSFNWIFALNYYKESESLTEIRFDKIIHVLYWQAKHVYANINFSKIAVRNNHAITESLGVYTFGLMFPFFPESKKWKKNGKKWFENEIAYQIYDDGTFLQFSLNYHRVAIQLLTWAIVLNKLNDNSFNEIVYSHAKKSAFYLSTCMIKENGHLPNYGANDGALFFKFGMQDFRDYRPQVEALKFALSMDSDEFGSEEKYWFGYKKASPINGISNLPEKVRGFDSELNKFELGGYYTIKEFDDSFTFIRCGNHKDRPSQADNLHVDIWVGTKNIVRDCGSYKYNSSQSDLKYFFGSASHNTVMLGEYDQMMKGERFTWYYWSQSSFATLEKNTNCITFEGQIEAYKHLSGGITHKRKIQKKTGYLFWEIEDTVNENHGLAVHQIWNLHDDFFKEYSIIAIDENNLQIEMKFEEGYYSGYYGQKEKAIRVVFTTKGKSILTRISKNEN